MTKRSPTAGGVTLAISLTLLMAAGCGSGRRGTFVLLPDPDGNVGAITVTRNGNAQVVDQAWHAVEVAAGAEGPSAPVPVASERIEQDFRAVFTAAPAEPARYLLNFKADSTALTDESLARLPEIAAEIAARQSVDTSVVGHTDTSGGAEYNYRLSLQRAQAVAALLVEAGVSEKILEINSHGEENPLIPTADEVPEPRNRRVEVTVR